MHHIDIINMNSLNIPDINKIKIPSGVKYRAISIVYKTNDKFLIGR